MKKVAENIRIFRQLRHLTHDQMAKQLSISRVSFVKIESGRIAISMDTIYKISEILGISPEALIYIPLEKTDGNPKPATPPAISEILPEAAFVQRVNKIEAKLEELFSLVIGLVQVVEVVQKINATGDKSAEE